MTIYTHYKSKKLYKLLFTGRKEDDLIMYAVYQSMENGQVWLRPIDEFFELISTAEGIHPRFEAVESNTGKLTDKEYQSLIITKLKHEKMCASDLVDFFKNSFGLDPSAVNHNIAVLRFRGEIDYTQGNLLAVKEKG